MKTPYTSLPLEREGLPCGVCSVTPQGRGGGEEEDLVPPHLNPLPPGERIK
jgi:hypothetical protein